MLIVYKHDGIFSGWCKARSRNFSFAGKTPSEQDRHPRSGSWGTALAIVFSRSERKHDISLWVHDEALAASLRRTRETKRICRTTPSGERERHEQPQRGCFRSDDRGRRDALGARERRLHGGSSPLFARRDLCQRDERARACDAPEDEHGSHAGSPANGLAQVFPTHCLLSGPSFAAEAARGEPTAVVLAHATSPSRLDYRRSLPRRRSGFTQRRCPWLELAGAMKNVMAIAAGACQGLGLGSNALAALITRGLAE